MRVSRFQSAPPDVLVAAALLGAALLDVALLRPSAHLWVLLAVQLMIVAPIAVATRFPVGAVAVSMGGLTLSGLFDDPRWTRIASLLAVLYTIWTALRRVSSQRLIAIPVVLLLCFYINALVGGGSLDGLLFGIAFFGGAVAMGLLVRSRDRQLDEARAAAATAEREAAGDKARAAMAERARLARELHDIVSHSISVITVQTQAVRRRLVPAQQQEIDDLRAVEAVAREAMAEMRRLFGVLPADGEGPPLAPQPGLEQLRPLVQGFARAGLSVVLEVTGTARALTPGVDLAAYRVVQESLTNVRRHAGTARATVEVSYEPHHLLVRVSDDGGDGEPDLQPGGYGLAGMQQRVELYGGTLTHGYRLGGGYRVQACLPAPAGVSSP